MRTLILFIAFIVLNVPTGLYAQQSVRCPSCDGSGSEVIKCEKCHNGAVLCNTCKGAGKKTRRCSNCNNGYVEKTSKITCSICRGSGATKVAQSTPCSCRDGKVPATTRGGNTIYIDCSRCGGTGFLTTYVNQTCGSCRGNGFTLRQEAEKCSLCNNGVVSDMCNSCNGNGSVMCTSCKGFANVKHTCSRCRGRGTIFVAN